jgi:rod shape-determining protein MreC
MFADSRFDYISRLRYYTGIAVTPLHYVANLPGRALDSMRGSVRSRDELATENESLREQLLMQQYQLQKLEYLTAENERLNALLKASAIVEEEVVRVQLIGVSPDPFSKRILINKGSSENVYVGQPVIDAFGLMGQVVEVQLQSSWVLLITDPQHGTPVLVNRNGLRAIAYGTRDNFHQLTLNDVPNTADIEEGDLLFTSGLGQKFPPGYPVGVVTSIYHDPGKPFADVIATPTAQIDRSRNLLLVFENRVQVRVPQEPVAAPEQAAADAQALGDTTPLTTPATDAPPAETPQGDAPQAELPQTELPQAEIPQAEASHAEAPPTETVPAQTVPDTTLQSQTETVAPAEAVAPDASEAVAAPPAATEQN